MTERPPSRRLDTMEIVSAGRIARPAGLPAPQGSAWSCHVHMDQVGGPQWIEDERYKVIANKPPETTLDPKLKAAQEKPIRVTGDDHIQSMNTTVKSFARLLSGWLHRPVFDETGVQGKYDITLRAGQICSHR
jgi:hypothetical protein